MAMLEEQDLPIVYSAGGRQLVFIPVVYVSILIGGVVTALLLLVKKILKRGRGN
jgi:hypothetical protein